MQLLIDRLISYIAPHQCIGCDTDGDILCSFCINLFPTQEPQCYKCQKSSADNRTCKTCSRESPLSAVYAYTPYESVAETLLKQLKFHRTLAAAPCIVHILHQAFHAELHKNVLLVPIPTATNRIRQRGYDQAVVITKLLAQKTGLPYSCALKKYGQARQTSSSRAQRFEQIQQALTVAKPKAIQGQDILLIDDVITTGATLEAAAELLLQADAKSVNAMTFARTL